MQPETADLPVLYVAENAPCCREAVELLEGVGVGHVVKDVSVDAEARATLRKLVSSGTVPTLVWQGELISGFTRENLVEFLQQHNVKLEDS